MADNSLYHGTFIDLTSEMEPQKVIGDEAVIFVDGSESLKQVSSKIKSALSQSTSNTPPLRTYSKIENARVATLLSAKQSDTNSTQVKFKSSISSITAEQKKINPVSVFQNKLTPTTGNIQQTSTNLSTKSVKKPQAMISPNKTQQTLSNLCNESPKNLLGTFTPSKTQPTSSNLSNASVKNPPPKNNQPDASGCSTSSFFGFDDDVEETSGYKVLTPSSSEIRRKKFPVDPLLESNDNSDDDVILVDQSKSVVANKSGDFAEITPIRNGLVRTDLNSQQKTVQTKKNVFTNKSATPNPKIACTNTNKNVTPNPKSATNQTSHQKLGQKVVTTGNQKVVNLSQKNASPNQKLTSNFNQKVVQNRPANLHQGTATPRQKSTSNLNQKVVQNLQKTVMNPNPKILTGGNKKFVQNSLQGLTNASRPRNVQNIQTSQIVSQPLNSAAGPISVLKRNQLQEVRSQKNVVLTDRTLLNVKGMTPPKPAQQIVNKKLLQQVGNKQPLQQVVNKQPLQQVVNKQPLQRVANQLPLQQVNKPSSQQVVNKQPLPQVVNKQPLPQVNKQPLQQVANKQPLQHVVNTESVQYGDMNLLQKSNISNIVIRSVYSVSNAQEGLREIHPTSTLLPQLTPLGDATSTSTDDDILFYEDGAEGLGSSAKILSPVKLNQTVIDQIRQKMFSQQNVDRVGRTATVVNQLKSKPPQKVVKELSQKQNTLADIVETANAVAAITPNGDEMLPGKGNLVFLVYPLDSHPDSVPSSEGQVNQVLALVPSDSDLVAKNPPPVLKIGQGFDSDSNLEANNPPPLQKIVRDFESEFYAYEDPLPSSKPKVKEAEVAPPPVFVPVDINQIINRGKKPEINGRCQGFGKKYEGTFFRGFTRIEKKKSSCIKEMKNLIKEETKKIAKMKKAAKERYESNIVYCGTAGNYFLPENVEVKSEYEIVEEMQIEDDVESLPTISEVISQVNQEVLQMKQAQQKQKSKEKSRQPHQSKAEEALSLIKKGLELIQSLSLEAGKTVETANESQKVKPTRKRTVPEDVRKGLDDLVKRKRTPKQGINEKKVVKMGRAKESEIEKRKTVKTRVSRKGAKSKVNSQNEDSSDDLLVVRRVDIIKSDGNVKKARRKRKQIL